MRILIFGGDERMISAALYLKKAGCDVKIFAIDPDILKSNRAEDLRSDSFEGCSAIVFPLPFSTDGVNINCPFSNVVYKAIDVLKSVKNNTKLFTGMAGSFFKNAAAEYGLNITDYYESEQFQIRNAVPTAEGAIWTLMNNSKKTVFGSRIAVTGCGKVGKCLADRLNKLGAYVTVTARGERDLAWAESMGMRSVEISEFLSSVDGYDCIFNTVPCNICDTACVRSIAPDTVYIELASKPYGMSKECETILGNRHIPAPSLPGKTAPVTAGIIIGKTIENYL